MNTEFRSRIGEALDYNQLLNYGLCCKAGDIIGFTGEFNFNSCYATGGVFIPYENHIISNTNGSLKFNNTCPEI